MEKKPFNDVTEHYGKHVGMPIHKVEMNKLPKPLRLFGYFAFSFLGISGAFIVIMIILDKL